MDSSPTQTLQDLLQQIIEWIQKSHAVYERNKKKVRKKHVYRVNVPCSSSDLRILRNYVSSLGVYSKFSPQMYEERWRNEVWDGRFKPENYKQVAEMVVCFLNDLKEVLKVPKLQHEEDTLKKNDLVAGFLEFLSQLLTNNTHLSALGVDRVLKELRCFVTIFWDKLFQAMDHEQVQYLSTQFEELVNKAGRFVYYYIFSSDQVVITVDEFLLEPISRFKHNIIEFLKTLPNLPTSKVAYHDVDSLFIIGSLLHDLEDSMKRSDNPLIEVKDQVEKLCQRLLLSWPLLEEHLENKEFKEIVMQIRDMAYEVEYLINSFLVGDVPIWYLSISLENVIHHIDHMDTQAQDTKRICDPIRAAKSFGTPQSLQGESGIEMDDILIGFENEEKNILDQLLGGTPNLQIISIVGTPGLGKTTLAKKLHYHHAVGDRFNRRCWCVVSEVYQKTTLLVDILKNLGEDVDTNIDEPSAKLKIRQVLCRRRYLITLDDIWTSSAWDDLQNCFPNEQMGSRILITSRHRDVVPRSSIINALPFLSKDQCWQILEKRVFRGETCSPMLQSIGMDIAAKCKGLPLLATVVAGLLSDVDREPSSWNIVRDEVHSYGFLDEKNPTLQILELSYKHLSQHLKPCLLYFGIFQEDTAIPTKKLKQLWIAEGFIHKYKTKDSEKDRENVAEEYLMELIAEEYLMELINKSLVMVVNKQSNGRVKACAMHDLLREMCLRIAEEENFLKRIHRSRDIRFPYSYKNIQPYGRLAVGEGENFLKQIDSEHLMYTVKSNRLVFQSSAIYLKPYGPWIRSFFCLDHQPYEYIFVGNMKLLRILDCWAKWGRSFKLVGIENLVNLRYLAVREVPKSIGNLVNLEYLIVNQEVHIPSFIQKMLKLRYLKAGSVTFDSDCDIFQANNLEFLSILYIWNQRDEEFLKYLPHLRKLKCNYRISQEVKSASQCFDLSFLNRLLSLSVSSSASYFSKSRMTMIKFPTTIRRLTLSRVNFSWKKISAIGELPNLEVLKLENDAFVGKKWVSSEGEFKKLRVLKLHDMDLVMWKVSSSEHFPNLQQLFLHGCYLLKRIPREIGNVNTLQLIKVSHCGASVIKSTLEIEKEQEYWGNDSLKIISDRIHDMMA